MMQMNKKVMIAIMVAASIAVAGGGSYLVVRNMDRDVITTEKKVFTEAEEQALEKQINSAIDAYILDFAKGGQVTALMSDEDKAELGKQILTDLSKNMTDEELTMVKELLAKLFSKNGGLTMTGSAYFTEETKRYLAANMKEAVMVALEGYMKEGTDTHQELQTVVEKIVSENIGNSNISYSLTSADIANIKQSVLSSLGNIQGAAGKDGIDGKDGLNGKDGADGEDGRDGKDGKDGLNGQDGKDGIDGKNGIDGKDGLNGRDGRDGKDGVDGKDGADGKDGLNGRDGRDGKDGVNGIDGKDGKDGKDGYTPVKGTDYFTESEVNTIVSSITTHMESYVNNQELAEAIGEQLIADGSITLVNTGTPVKGKDYFTEEEITAITATIRNSVMDVFEKSAEEITENMNQGNNNLTDMIGTSEESTNNSNIYNPEKTYKAGDVIVKDGVIYICTEAIADGEEWNEEHWSSTDLVSINNYYNEYVTESIIQMTERYEAGMADLDSKLSNQIQDDVANLDGKLTGQIQDNVSSLDSKLSSQIQNDVNSLDSKLSSQIQNDVSSLDSKLSSQIQNDVSSLDSKLTGQIQDNVSSLDEKLTEKINVNVTTLNETVTSLENAVNTRFETVISSFQEKVTELTNAVSERFTQMTTEYDKKLNDLEESQASYRLIDNGDGTYSLEITDPKAN